MVILVTGGGGFIGSHVVEALTAGGHTAVVASRRRGLDISDRHALLALSEQHEIEGIVHLADPSLNHLADATTNVVDDLRAGANALFNVLEAALTWGVRRIIVASTIGVYGGLPDLRGVREDQPLALAPGGNLVPTVKKSAELLARAAAGDLVVCARLAAVWGPRGRAESRFFAAPGLVHAAVNGTPPPAAHADDAIDLLYVRDCARALALLMTAADVRQPTYNVGTGFATSNGEIAAAITRRLPRAELPLEPGRSAHGAPAYLDVTRLREDTGFEPAFDLDASVADYVAWLTDGNER